MESDAHLNLKVLAMRWLLAPASTGGGGCAAAACEVRCPISRYRVDAAGYADAGQGDEGAGGNVARATRLAPGILIGRTAFIECKASRSDFLRDTRDRPRLLTARERLNRELDHVRAEVIRPMEPHLRKSGTYLFDEMETWDYARSESKAARAILRELRRIDLALHDQTKFFMLAQYRLAHRLLLLAPAGMIEATEVPRGWGLLVPAGTDASGRMAIEPAVLDSPPARVFRTLRNIAAARH